MKKLSKLRLPLIERELSVLNEEELRAYIGGQKQSCVFNCFDYLDGSLHSANDYYNWTKQGLGYEPDEHGNVDISDVGTIGGYGGVNVSKVNSGESFILRSDVFKVSIVKRGKCLILASNRQTSNGERVMAVFAVGSESNEEGHAVVISGFYRTDDERIVYYYYDPTSLCSGSILSDDCDSLYLVKHENPNT